MTKTFAKRKNGSTGGRIALAPKKMIFSRTNQFLTSPLLLCYLSTSVVNLAELNLLFPRFVLGKIGDELVVILGF